MQERAKTFATAVLMFAAATSAACGGSVSVGGNGAADGDSAGTSTSSESLATEEAADHATCTSAPAFSVAPAACRAAADADALDEGLAALGTARCSLGFAGADLATSMFDPIRESGGADYLALHAHPLALPAYGSAWETALHDAAATSSPVTQALATAAAHRGPGDSVDVCLSNWTPIATDATPLVTALRELGATAADAAAAADVDADLQLALAPVVHALAEANLAVSAVRAENSAWLHAFSTLPTWVGGVRHFDLDASSASALQAIDVASIERAAVRLSATVEHANLERFAGRTTRARTIATPMGAVLIRGSESDAYGPEADHALLVFDTGGDDVYKCSIAASSEASSVSLSIDLAGNDTYSYAEVADPSDDVGQRLPSDGEGRTPDGRSESTTFRQGAGVFGIGFLFDLGGGADSYRSLVGSQGMGALGVGVLYDDGGDDGYTAESFAQGAGEFGIGLLLDAAGDDHATLYNSGQGFGFSAGVGLLLDVAGNDDYYANPGDPSLGGDRLYGSDQLPGPPASTLAGNMSMAQGVGAGHRPDWPDPGFPFAGGIGVLADLAGADSYRAGVWAQGTGFVAGVGLLLDHAGNDQFDALYYAQGSTAHMGIGLHQDDGGDDRYDARYPAQDAELGFGGDFSVGMHVDRGGNDLYVGAAMGGADGNAIGIAVNVGGGDSFSTGGAALGWAAPPDDVARASIPAYGLFVKAGGSATYETHAEGDTWGSVVGVSNDLPALRSLGEDRPNGDVRF